MAKIVPRPSVLIALARQNLTMRTILGELIDNAVDAGATSVAASFAKDHFVIEDNGDGAKNVLALVHIGVHEEHKTTGLGIYGIGAKDAVLALSGAAGNVSAYSVRAGRARSVTVDWGQMGPEWDIMDPIDLPAEPGQRGTRIVVSPCCRRPPHGQQWRELVEEIGYQYSPAIKNGVQITLASSATKGRPQPAPRWVLPKLEPEKIDTELRIGNRRARVHVGLVEAGQQNPHPGLTYSYRYRVILPDSSKGCGEYPIGKICGFVELLSGWTLSKNKNAIIGAEDLFDEVEKAILPVLQRAQKASAILGCREFEAGLSAQLNGFIAGAKGAKAKRGKGDREGSRLPTGKGKTHEQAATEQDGTTFRGRNSGGFRVEHAELGGHRIGDVKERVVLLNLNNSWVAGALRTLNDQASITLAVALLAEHDRTENPSGQRIIRSLESESLSSLMGRFLASNPSLDGRPILRAVGNAI